VATSAKGLESGESGVRTPFIGRNYRVIGAPGYSFGGPHGARRSSTQPTSRPRAFPRYLTAGGYRPSSHPLGYSVLRVALGVGSEPQIRAVASNRTGNATPDALPRCCAIAGARNSDALLRGRGLEEGDYTALCHSAIGVRLPGNVAHPVFITNSV
jgi:hypothetical protein